jgi:hypothetical protein
MRGFSGQTSALEGKVIVFILRSINKTICNGLDRASLSNVHWTFNGTPWRTGYPGACVRGGCRYPWATQAAAMASPPETACWAVTP